MTYPMTEGHSKSSPQFMHSQELPTRRHKSLGCVKSQEGQRDGSSPKNCRKKATWSSVNLVVKEKDTESGRFRSSTATIIYRRPQ